MRDFKLGVIVRADETGLGYQTRDYYKHLKPDKTILIDLSPLNGNEQYYDWYENYMLIKGIPSMAQVEEMLDGIDVLLTAETPYNLALYKRARECGIKTICVENAEFYDHIKYPEYDMPDLIILPSVWHLDEIKRHAESRGTKFVQIHHPVDRETHPFRLRTGTKTMHTAGKPATHDRNGTWDYLYAVPNGIVVTQDEGFARQIRSRYSNSKVFTGIKDFNTMYSYGDIFVLPRKYGGNCLPLNEALSHGLPVIMPDISPNNNLLPKEWLVPATITDWFEPRGRVDVYTVDFDALLDRIDWVATNIESQSMLANEIADSISWTTLLPKYEEAIRSIVHGG